MIKMERLNGEYKIEIYEDGKIYRATADNARDALAIVEAWTSGPCPTVAPVVPCQCPCGVMPRTYYHASEMCGPDGWGVACSDCGRSTYLPGGTRDAAIEQWGIETVESMR
jgi:hypothetical protein